MFYIFLYYNIIRVTTVRLQRDIVRNSIIIIIHLIQVLYIIITSSKTKLHNEQNLCRIQIS